MTTDENMKIPQVGGNVEITTLNVEGNMIGNISVYRTSDDKELWVTVSVFADANLNVSRLRTKIFTNKPIKSKWVKPSDGTKKFRVHELETKNKKGC